MKRCLAVAAVMATLAAAPSRAQFAVTSQDGKSSFKLGVLLQPEGEWIDSADGEHTSQSLFMRRMRLLLGGKLGDKLSFFVDTDSPNYGRAGADGKKNDVNMYVQDAFLTYSVSPTVMVDAGMMLLPLSHNTQQGATTLYAIDYGPGSFAASAPMGSKVGRDYGTQLRAYLLSNHLELRGAVTQGVRGTDSSLPLRTTFRAVYYLFDAETGFFYTGTSFGKKRLVAFGASYDRQRDYSTLAGDVAVDYPVGKAGDTVTFQADYVKYDGGDMLGGALPEQDAMLVEGGYYFARVKVSPFLQYSRRTYQRFAIPTETYSQLGLTWWQSGHTFNLKLGVGRIEKEGYEDRTQVLLQAQLFYF
jgi:hypothetical protein